MRPGINAGRPYQWLPYHTRRARHWERVVHVSLPGSHLTFVPQCATLHMPQDRIRSVGVRRIAVTDIDPRTLEKLARKNREESQRRYEEDTKKPSIGASKKRRKELEGSAPPDDPRYEGVNRLFTEMKKKDRK